MGASGSVIKVASLRPGDHFGEHTLLNGEPRVATVMAETEVVVLEVMVFWRPFWAYFGVDLGSSDRQSELNHLTKILFFGQEKSCSNLPPPGPPRSVPHVPRTPMKISK